MLTPSMIDIYISYKLVFVTPITSRETALQYFNPMALELEDDIVP